MTSMFWIPTGLRHLNHHLDLPNASKRVTAKGIGMTVLSIVGVIVVFSLGFLFGLAVGAHHKEIG